MTWRLPMNRKLRKLLTNPSLFVRDMVQNRIEDVDRMLPRRRASRGKRRYSVVSAVYGVEKYLDEFFESLVRQTLDFERHIELIMVDDGSPDRSAEIIQRWQRKYPCSIRYVKKENGGQASARNLGLEHATGDWVTFIDPDDFVHARYFQRVDDLLSRPDAQNVSLVACKMVFRRGGKTSDTHPLRSQFSAGDAIVPIGRDSTFVHCSASTAFFRRDLLADLRFDEEIRPCAEDVHFVAKYLMANRGRDIAFCARARYYYRKREDASSTLDQAWSHPGRYDIVLSRGYLDLLRRAAKQDPDGRPALWVQRTILYQLIWYLRDLISKPEVASHLSGEQRARFHVLLREILTYIDADPILKFDLAGAWLYHKVGLLGMKSITPELQHVYVDRYDGAKDLVQLRYFSAHDDVMESFEVGGREIHPAFAKVRRHDLLGEAFVWERIVWLSMRDITGRLSVTIGDTKARIVVRGRVHGESVDVRELSRVLAPVGQGTLPPEVRLAHRLAKSRIASEKFRDAFLFMDRDTQADDNAEHLYRYVKAHRPDINAFFVLRRSSHDWKRLEAEGFRLLAFGSLAHRLALVHAKHLISSHVDEYVVNYPKGKGWSALRAKRRFTFLQHGVTKDDISGWLNGKEIDCFVTASPGEYASIVENGGPYRFTEREVVLSGFPRHDKLGAGDLRPERILVIMPTWRAALAGPVVGAGNSRAINPKFYESEYARRWRSLLHAPALKSLVEQHGFRVRFFPHANVQPYISWFDPPPHVETLTHSAGQSIQDVLRSAAILLTDYSSVAFDTAYLRRAVVYYQFDREQVFGGGHIVRKGYFDYDRDGFGPVCFDEEAVLDALETLMAAGGTPAPEHLERMERTFAFRDGRACERTLEAILDLDRPTHARDRSDALLVEAARSATRHRAWERAEHRWSLVLARGLDASPDDAELRLVEAKRELGKVDEADVLLAAMEARGEVTDPLRLARAELATAVEDWPRAASLWAEIARAAGDSETHERAVVRLAEAYRRQGEFAQAAAALDAAATPESIAVRTEEAELASAKRDFRAAAEKWKALVQAPGAPEQSFVRFAEALAELGRRDRALAVIEQYLPRASNREYERQARLLRLRLATPPRSDVVAMSEPAAE